MTPEEEQRLIEQIEEFESRADYYRREIPEDYRLNPARNYSGPNELLAKGYSDSAQMLRDLLRSRALGGRVRL